MKLLAGMSVVVCLLLAMTVSAQEVHNPWEGHVVSEPSPAPARPPVPARQVHLVPMDTQLPPWSFQEVLNPWDEDANMRMQLRVDERSLTLVARQRAVRIAGCFPESYSARYSFTRLYHSSPAGTLNTGGDLGRCLRSAMEDVSGSAGFVLALRFDEEGLREIYVRRQDR